MKHLKIDDTVQVPGSRLADFWTGNQVQDFYKKFRSGYKLPQSLVKQVNSIEAIQTRYHLKGFQFGRWANNEDRFNYLAALYVCLHDLNKVLAFKNNNIGLDQNLSISIGARGSSGALGHFEPGQEVINITRFKRFDVMKKQIEESPFLSTQQKTRAIKALEPKIVRFITTGGVGVFAHEYGHYLDYFFGRNYDIHPQDAALSGGDSTNTKRIAFTAKNPMRLAMENLLMAAIWRDEKKGIQSAFYKRVKTYSLGDYWKRRNELFARIFEAYISQELTKRGIYNKFLSHVKYSPQVYPKPAELKHLTPYMNKLIKELKTKF